MIAKKMIIISLLLLPLSGCTYIYGEKGIIKNRDTDYLQSHSIAPLRYPPGIPHASVEEHYPVPDRHYPEAAKRVNLIPPEL